MNMQQVVQPRSSSNGYGRRKVERDTATRSDKLQTGKTYSSKASFGKGGSLESPSRDRLLYLTSSFIGQQVEVQVVDGSVYSGIFHATNSEDFGIVLKMAHLIKDGSRGQKNMSDSSKPVGKLIIPSKDLVQVIGKEVHVTRDGVSNELQHEKQLELLTDSCISQSRHVEAGRELERWVPDENDTHCPELENVFDGPWNRGWDQFQTNAALFGVKSTFNEDLYTTRLERGPQTRELEREAMRIAKEIEGENTLDLHLAEERGIQLDGSLELDEETRFSSVRRADDSGYDETEDILLDSRNDETFGDVSSSVAVKPLVVMNTGKTNDGTQGSSRFSSMGEVQSSVSTMSRDVFHLGSKDNEKHLVPDQSRASKTEDSDSIRRLKKDSSDEAALSPDATSFEPSKGQEKTNELPNGSLPPKAQGTTTSLARPSSSASSTSERGGATSTSASRGLSPTSSVNSLTSEKSTLNPHAKEFKFNPNAKSFVPTQSSLRPLSPAPDNPFYYPANVAPMHGMPLGVGMGPSFPGQQHVMFNPQAGPMPQPYYHPNGPQYGQQMMIGQPRPLLYMPTYPTQEMPYNKGREF